MFSFFFAWLQRSPNPYLRIHLGLLGSAGALHPWRGTVGPAHETGGPAHAHRVLPAVLGDVARAAANAAENGARDVLLLGAPARCGE